jgi:hypothetical protein
MRFWTAELKRTGRPLNNNGLFAGPTINIIVIRYALDLLHTELTKEDTVEKPKELTDLMKWEVFWEQWRTYMGHLQGVAKYPLLYVFRDHAFVLPEHRVIGHLV